MNGYYETTNLGGNSMISEQKTEFEILSTLRRNREITNGLVRSAGARKMPVTGENGRTETKPVECAVFDLIGGAIGYCPIHEFSDHELKSLAGFVGSRLDILIEKVDEDPETGKTVALVSVKKADELKRERFWEHLRTLESEGRLKDEVFEGFVTGFNDKTQKVYVRIEGADTFMYRQDWQHSKMRGRLDNYIERNMVIPVKVLRFNEETKQVHVSRKDAIPNPWEDMRDYVDEVILGRVTHISPRDGIFVQVEKGVEVKGTVPHKIPEPIVGEIVRCALKSINVEQQRGRVIIFGYPEGKKKKVDIGSFLFN